MGQREEETTIAVATFSSIRQTVTRIQLTRGPDSTSWAPIFTTRTRVITA